MAQLLDIPPYNLVLVVGLPGTGKSYFCRQAVLENAKRNRPIIFLTTECTPSQAEAAMRGQVSSLQDSTVKYIDAYHETLGITSESKHPRANCGDLSSFDIAIERLQVELDATDVLLVVDSLTSPYLFNGSEIVRFMRTTLLRFAAEGNAVLACIDEGCGKPEDLGAMMSIATGIIRLEMADEQRIYHVLKHPQVAPQRVDVALGVPPPATSFTALNKKLDWIINRLDFLERILTETQQYPEAVGFLRSLRIGTAIYGEPLKTLDRLVSARRLSEATPIRDEISKIILNTVALKGPQNISQLTREVRIQRGKASRSTIRNRVTQLIERRALVREGTRYRLAE